VTACCCFFAAWSDFFEACAQVTEMLSGSVSPEKVSPETPGTQVCTVQDTVTIHSSSLYFPSLYFLSPDVAENLQLWLYPCHHWTFSLIEKWTFVPEEHSFEIGLSVWLVSLHAVFTTSESFIDVSNASSS
jgi:hypothetical protein